MVQPTHALPVKTTNPDACRNMCALVNSKSGERASAAFLFTHLKASLGEDRIVDLSECFKDQTKALDLLKNKGSKGVVIVGGGDGTVSWVMDLVDKVQWDDPADRPYISVIPMGTGNDLSRCLGFGPGFTKETCCCSCSGCCTLKSLDKVIESCVPTAYVGTMDRWSLTASQKGVVVDSHPVNNYFSIGFDASIATKFDTFRRKHPGLCKARFMNKMWYGCFGFGAMCGSPTLEKIVKLNVDGKDVAVPKGIKSLVVTNIDSFAGGVRLWKDGRKTYKPQRFDDQLVEICGIYGSTHMAFMQVKMRSAVKIAQGQDVVITTSVPLSMQWDGEPLSKVTEAAKIEIKPLAQPRILHRLTSK
eukprot:PhM_4_TR1746/c0_g1_i1/m.41996/K00901/dgkA, DGK; diacylglycerol kinase (ATP)